MMMISLWYDDENDHYNDGDDEEEEFDQEGE